MGVYSTASRLAKENQILKSALREISFQTAKYVGCRCSLEENGGMGDCWPCRMVMIGFIAEEALDEERGLK